MQVHADFGGAATYSIRREAYKFLAARHVAISQICRLQSVLLTQLLKSRNIARILRSDARWRRPEVVPFSVDGDDECRLHRFAASWGATYHLICRRKTKLIMAAV